MDSFEIKRLQRKIERALECNVPKEAVDISMELGAYYASHEKYENALGKYKDAFSICIEKNLISEAAVSQRMIAETYCSLGEYKEAVKHADLYLNYSKKGKNKIEEQRGYATQGRIYFCWAEFLVNEKSKCRKEIKKLFQESLMAYEKSLKICEVELNEINAKERQEMKARLFQNLGLVMGSLGNFKEANAHFATAIQINKAQNFKENLYWCYINQGEYFLRAGESASACTYFDMAVKATTSAENANEALKLKAKSFLKMGNVSAAKSILRDVYKKQLGKDQEVVEQLRIVVYLCKVDKMIDSTPDSDNESKKNLFEKKGDAYCALKQYGQGVESYLKMLEYAEKCSSSRKDLLPCYSSLSQTYKDDEQYNSALLYCQKELELLSENSAEACKTYLFLAELYEILDYDFDTIYCTYKKAQKISQEIGDKGQEIIVLRNIIQLQKDFGYISLAEGNEKLLTELENKLGDVIGNDDDCEADSNTADNFICDVDDNELLSDVEEAKPRHQVRRTAYKVKRNRKGETELHVATIHGNYPKVKSLIEKGHPVNEKDLAGWTVLHEACNHGHVNIVELLLNSGADVNNPGGDECGGITPLHDAAENGHFPVIKLLLKRGACPALLTNDGDTPLDCLKRWQSRSTLTEAESHTYQKLCDELKTNLDSKDLKQRIGLTDVDLLPRRNTAKEIEFRTRSLDDGIETCPVSSKGPGGKSVSATELYRSAIEAVRRKPNSKLITKKSKKIVPLINEDDLSENLSEEWLEDDMETTHQPAKRRRVLPEERKSSPVRRSESRDHNFSDVDIEMLSNASISDRSDIDSAREECPSPVLTVNRVKPPTEILLPEENCDNTSTNRDHTQEDSHPVIENHSVNEKSNIGKETDLHKFKIQILSDLFLVPALRSELKELTVDWLAKEAEERYGKIHGKRPTLLLMTEDDAIVSKDDPVALLVNENVKTRIIGWKETTLAKKYEEESSLYRREVSLSALDYKPDLSIMNALNMFSKSGNLILTNLRLEVREIMILLEILEREKFDVKVLDLSRNYLRDDGLEPLMKYLERRSIERLYLRSNGISAEGIKHFCRRLEDVPEASLNKILALDFSYNILRDVSADSLNAIIEKLRNLECLGTENCFITKTLKELQKNRGESVRKTP